MVGTLHSYSLFVICLMFTEKVYISFTPESTSDYVNGAQIKLFAVIKLLILIHMYWNAVTRRVKQTKCSVVPMYGYTVHIHKVLSLIIRYLF